MAYIEYRNGFNGTYKVGGQTLLIGKEKLMPYDMTYGAIASCLYSISLNPWERGDLKFQVRTW